MDTPSFNQVYDLVRSNLVGATAAEMNRAAVRGFLSQFQSRVNIVTNDAPPPDTSTPLVRQARVLDRNFAWLQIGRVGPGLAKAVSAAYQPLPSSNALEGVIVDLRFAGGIDYATAAETADLFFKTEQALLKWGDSAVRSTAKASAIDLPLVVLVNGETSGAAEALAAALRQTEGAVLVGNPTAGEAYLFKVFPLGGGESLRIAHGYVTAGKGEVLSDRGINPDIRVGVSAAEEREFMDDPYQTVPNPLARSTHGRSAEESSTASTNRPRHRLNEADLVRMQQEGEDADSDASDLASGPAQPGTPVLADPVLSRALDILKGVTMALKRR